MNKYRKGRLLVLTGMLAFSTATVLVGTAAADKGTIKINVAGDTSNGNVPKQNGCFDINASSLDTGTGVHVTVTLMNPTAGAGNVVLDTTFPAGSTLNVDKASLMNKDGSAVPDPSHIKVAVDDGSAHAKTKTIWVTGSTCVIDTSGDGGPS